MKIKNIILLSGAALLISTSTFAFTVHYQMTNPGSKECTVVPSSMNALCANFHPSMPSFHSQFTYDTDTKILTTIVPGMKTFYWKFTGNIFYTKQCWAFDTAAKEPLAYCQNAFNNYLLVTVSANRNTKSGVIQYNGTIQSNLPESGYVINAEIHDARLSPEVD